MIFRAILNGLKSFNSRTFTLTLTTWSENERNVIIQFAAERLMVTQIQRTLIPGRLQRRMVMEDVDYHTLLWRKCSERPPLTIR